MPGRRWSDGLHQAIEAKEGLKIQNESVTQASISYQVSLYLGIYDCRPADECRDRSGVDIDELPGGGVMSSHGEECSSPQEL